MSRIPLLLVDDNPTFLYAAVGFLQAHEEVNVVGTASSGEEALAQAQALRPQVILLDLSMPDMLGLNIIPLVREVLPEAGIVVLTLLDTDGYRGAALMAGADEFVSKASLSADLLSAIRRAANKAAGSKEARGSAGTRRKS